MLSFIHAKLINIYIYFPWCLESMSKYINLEVRNGCHAWSDLDLWMTHCHNPIFTHRIFSGVGARNEAARTKPAWSDEGSPHQITSKRGLGRISRNPTKFSQGWPSLTKSRPSLTEVWPNRFRPDWGPIYLETLKMRSGTHSPEFG